MKRRTLLEQLGTATIATTALVGSAAAARPTIDRELDVSGVSGPVALKELLTEAEIARYGDGFGPMQVTVAEGTGSIDLNHCCETYQYCDDLDLCPCDCCLCWVEEPPDDK